MMKQSKDVDGYKIVRLTRNNEADRPALFVHRIVAEVFIPNPDNLPYVNQKG